MKRYTFLLFLAIIAALFGTGNSAEAQEANQIYTFSVNDSASFQVNWLGEPIVMTNDDSDALTDQAFQTDGLPFILAYHELESGELGQRTVWKSSETTESEIAGDSDVELIEGGIASNTALVVSFGTGEVGKIYTFSVNDSASFQVNWLGEPIVMTNDDSDALTDQAFQTDGLPFILAYHELESGELGQRTVWKSSETTESEIAGDSDVELIEGGIASNTALVVSFGTSLGGEASPNSCMVVGATVFATNNLNVRSEPNTRSTVLETMNAGESFVIQEVRGAWLRHEAGWSHSDFVNCTPTSENSDSDGNGNGQSSNNQVIFINQYFSSEVVNQFNGLNILSTESGQGEIGGRRFGGSHAVVVFSTTGGNHLTNFTEDNIVYTQHGEYVGFHANATCNHNQAADVTVVLEIAGAYFFSSPIPTPVTGSWCL